MQYDLRPVTEEEWPAYVRAVEMAFGTSPADDDVVEWRTVTELDRTLAAFEGDRIIGNAGAFSLELTVPGDNVIKMAGVTAVGVRSTHRRKGVLTSMMRAQLEDVRERGEPIAGLYASESIIYGRFGYGIASSQVQVVIDTDRAEYRAPLPDGRLDILDAEAAAKVLPEIHDRTRRQTPGDVTRSSGWWDLYFKDKEKDRQGASARFYVVHESQPGEADGYVAYRVKGDWPGGLPGATIAIQDMAWSSDAAYANLWRQVLDVDLVAKVDSWKRPVDEPLRWLLADPRRMQVRALTDELWLRPIDVPACLTTRQYLTTDRIVIEVVDDFLGSTAGRYVLDASPDGAACGTTDETVDLTLGVAELGSLYLGGVTASTLARAARVDEHTAGALTRADALFASNRAPYCRTMF
jgi:predicted acetyltransferase